MVAPRPRRLTKVLRDAKRTHDDIERWTTTLNTLIMQARAETEIIRTRPEGAITDARERRVEGPDSGH
jgi:hypothetical protein